jgi:hypothetical protein
VAPDLAPSATPLVRLSTLPTRYHERTEKTGSRPAVSVRVNPKGAGWNQVILEDNGDRLSLSELEQVEPKVKEVGGHALVEIRLML